MVLLIVCVVGKVYTGNKVSLFIVIEAWIFRLQLIKIVAFALRGLMESFILTMLMLTTTRCNLNFLCAM